jgi:site-specific recombinase XerD
MLLRKHKYTTTMIDLLNITGVRVMNAVTCKCIVIATGENKQEALDKGV